METFKRDLKTWLKTIGKNREWLGEQCGVKKRTVDSWFSWGTITAQTEKQLRLLMRQYPASTADAQMEENSLTLAVDASTFDSWNAAATREHKLLRQWACDVLTEKAEQTGKGK